MYFIFTAKYYVNKDEEGKVVLFEIIALVHLCIHSLIHFIAFKSVTRISVNIC